MSMILTGVSLLAFALNLGLFGPSLAHAGIAVDAEKPSCKLTEVNWSNTSSRYDLEVGGRKIAVLGWSHLSPSPIDMKDNAQLLEAAHSAASSGDCNESESRLKDLLRRNTTHLSNSVELAERLKEVQAKFQPQVLGVEYSPEGWIQRGRNHEVEAYIGEFIREKCPQISEPLMRKIALVFPGPEHQFLRSNQSTLVAHPLEDEKLSAEASSQAQEVTLLPPLAPEQLKPRAQTLYNKLMHRFALGELLPQSEIDAVIMAQGENEISAILAKYLLRFKRLMELNSLRNDAMADQVLKSQGNYAIPIGNTHARDLAHQILGKCEKGEFIAQPATGNYLDSSSQQRVDQFEPSAK
jgi:hypothetical protein